MSLHGGFHNGQRPAPRIRRGVAIVLSVGVAMLGGIATASSASALVPSVTTTCEVLTVDLVNYQIDPGQAETFRTVHHDAIPETTHTVHHDAVTHVVTHPAVTHTEWKYSEAAGPGQLWVDNDTFKFILNGSGTNDKPKDVTYYERTQLQRTVVDTAAWDETVVDTAAWDEQVGNGDGTPAWDEQVSNNDFRAPGTGKNHVVVTVNGTEVANTDFGTSYNQFFNFLPNQVNTYSVVVTAWDDLDGEEGRSFTESGREDGCVVLVPAAMSLTYMTACAPDVTNTWRIQNESDFPVPYTLEYADQGQVAEGIAAPGDSFVNLPRVTATATLKWGGGESKIIAGQETKASGVDGEKCVVVPPPPPPPPAQTLVIPDKPGIAVVKPVVQVRPAVLGVVEAAQGVKTPAAATPAAAAPTAAAPTVAELAFTGADPVPLSLLALFALVLGAALTVASKRQGGQRAGG